MATARLNKKPSAADRTVDMFSAAVVADAEKALAAVVPEDAVEVAKTSAEPLEDRIDGYRDNAMAMQQYISKSWMLQPEEKAGKETFRISRQGEWSFLEVLRHSPTGGLMYSWSGVMYRTADQHELTNVMVKASKELV